MNQNYIYFPVFTMFTLSVIVLQSMFRKRVKALKSNQVTAAYFKTYSTNENVPNDALQAARNYSNLFEAPTLFYVVCAFALITKNVDHYFYGLAWAYVLVRFFHSFVHLTSNKLLLRMKTFAISWIIFIMMAIKLALNIISF